MKPVFELALAVAWALSSANAQMSAVLNRLPNRSPEIAIRNDSPVNLTAFAISMAPISLDPTNPDPFLFYFDSSVDTDRVSFPSRLPIPPGGTYALPVTSSSRGGKHVDLFKPPIVAAAIFDDGMTSGDPGLLARLISRRRSMLQAVELARQILLDAGNRNVSRGQLVGQLNMLADSVDHWYLPLEQEVGRTLYQSIAERLMNLPQLQVGSPFPPTSFVEEEAARLNRQRTALLESPPGLGAFATLRQ